MTRITYHLSPIMPYVSRFVSRFLTHPSLLLLLIFIAALLPRLYALGTFLTIDEVKWVEGAAQFLLGLHSGDLFQTYWHFHPGITITWGSALALWAMCLPAPDLAVCANTHLESLAGSIGWLRLSPVLWTSLGVTGVYGLGRKLFGHGPALLTALLLAFDPFFVAHSRILNGDAGAAIFMFLSVLAFLVYWLGESANGESRHTIPAGSLILSALLAGLALLTKLPSPLIVVFIGGLSLVAMLLEWPREGLAALPRWGVTLLVWGGVVLLVFVALWPAMWVAPVETLRLMYVDAFEVGEVGQGHTTFFLGQIVSDPGLWFYPYAVAFRLTPVVIVGLLITLGWLIARVMCHVSRVLFHVTGPGSRFTPLTSHIPNPVSHIPHPPSLIPHPISHIPTAWVMLAFIIFIILFANVSPKKLDRYVMAVIPPLMLLSALGFTKIGQWCRDSRRWGKIFSSVSRSTCSLLSFFLMVGVVMFQLLFALFATPYYLTYYNPLLGDVRRAATQVPVGWGEGLEQAAFYLNQLPKAESLAVSSWYSDIFHPYFVGQRASFADDGRAQLVADYVVFYVNQIQRQKPYPGLVDYFRAGEPVFVVAVKPGGQVVNWSGADDGRGNVPWVEVYKAPAAQSISGAPKVEGVAQLLAYKVTGSTGTGNKVAGNRVAGSDFELVSGEDVSVTLFLRVLDLLPEETTFSLALFPVTASQNSHPEIQNPTWGRWRSTEIKGEWLTGNIVEWHGKLTLPPGMPPGEYRFWVVFRFKDGPVIAEIPISEKGPPILVREDHK